MSDHSTLLASFLAQEQRLALSRNQALPELAHGAALFADITGFTPLTRAFTGDLGATLGAEVLMTHLTGVFDRLIEATHQFRGSVIGFSGDAITCWFDGEEAVAARRALAAALQMRRAMAGHAVQLPGGQSFPISVKLAAASGPARRFLVGNPAQQCLSVLGGATLERMATAEQLAAGGEILLSSECVEALEIPLQIAEWRAAENGQRCAVIGTVEWSPEPLPWPELPALPVEQLKPWIANKVYEELVGGHAEFIGGFRRIAVLFLSFAGIDYDRDAAAGRRLDAFVREIQNILDRYDGQLIDMTIGDKGSYMSTAFGILRAHEDDARRALMAAAAMLEIPARQPGMGPLSVGIAYTQAYAGAYGGTARRTFGMLSDDVILAARLMSRAGPGEVLVAPQIARASLRWHRFEALAPMVFKGFPEPLQAHCLRGERQENSAALPLQNHFVGRHRELEKLQRSVEQCATAKTGPRLLIEGGAGMGKSTLLQALRDMAGRAGVHLLNGAADPIRSAAAYYPFRAVFESLLNLQAGQKSSERERQVQEALRAFDDEALAPLLNPVLGLELADTDTSRRMESSVRADNTHELLLRILKRAPAPCALVLEDLHWFDSASASLLRLLIQELDELGVYLCRRDESEAPEALDLPAQVEQLRLGPLDEAEVAALLQHTLGVSAIPEAVLSWIHAKAEGSPFFTRELALALRQTGVLELEAGRCQLAHGMENLDALDFPDTVQGTIAARLDRLPGEQQMAVKVASVIGREFAVQVLRDVHPVEQSRARLDASLQGLDQARIAHPLVEARSPAYLFSHVLTQEVAYGRLLHEQRALLHKAVGQWLETHATQGGDNLLPVLAHHFYHAARGHRCSRDLRDKALDYLGRAGARAVRGNMNREAVRYFCKALELAGDEQYPQAMRWHAGLAHAYDALGEFPASCEHSRIAFRLGGQPFPDHAAGMLRHAMAQFLRIVGRMLKRRSIFAATDAPVKQAAPDWPLDDPIQLLRVFSKSLWHENDILTMLSANLRCLALSDRAGPSAEMALCYSYWQLTLDVLRMPGLAEKFGRQALRIGIAANSPATVVTTQITHGMVHLAHARWSQARQHFSDAIRDAAELGDDNQWGEATAMLADVALIRGELEIGQRLYGDLQRNAQRRDSALQMAWCLRPQVLGAMADDEPAAVLETLSAYRGTFERSSDPLIMIDVLGFSAWAHWQLGQLKELDRSIAQAFALIPTVSPPVAYPRFFGYRALAEVCLARYQAEPGSRSSRQQAEFMLRSLKEYAGGYAYARPRLALSQAWLRAIRRPQGRVGRPLAEALQQAEAMALEPDVQLAHALIRRYG